MASILNRGPHQWQVTIRRKGYPSQTKTLETKREAEAWAAIVESEMARGVFTDRTEVERTTLGDLVERYRDEMSPTKRSCRTELVTARRLLRHSLALRPLSTLRSVDFARYRKQRLSEGAANNSVRLELAYLSAVFTTARKEWSIEVRNFIQLVRMPPTTPGRNRRLVEDEESRLLAAARTSKAPAFDLCIILAIETGMRAGNLIQLRWEDIDFDRHVIYVARTKNGAGLVVPLSEKAETALRSYPCSRKTGRITSFYDSAALGAAFRVACKKAGIKGLNFHDLRHDAATRLAPLVTAPTLAKLMGWKTIQMAMRYYNPTEEELVTLRREAEVARTNNIASADKAARGKLLEAGRC
ncbi:site-specific integrase [Janthinobacterium sp. JC611]|uniref:tyrosine-type recombinase/integrase n=1 Tax=Janthinobacterium sp. JC611 TaxID=2816201 RepID=UPI001BFE34B7|nr:site-specific integrase [Janthinobacterium sp. JC611]